MLRLSAPMEIKTKSKIIQIAEHVDLIGSFRDNHIPFNLKSTTFTKKVDCILGEFKFMEKGNNIKQHELYFIKKVQKHCLDIGKYPNVNRSLITYTRKNVFKKRVFKKEIYEIDLSAAYWTLTYRDGWLSDEIYKEGLTLSKEVRLISLGSLAKSLLDMDYDGYVYTRIEKCPPLPYAGIFFKAAATTDKYLKLAYLMSGDNAFFYWCDAIFITGKHTFKMVSDFFEANNLEFKSYKIDWLSVNKNIVTVSSKVYANKKKNPLKEKRVFTFDL